MDCRRDFAERLRGGKPLAGVFVKSRDPAHVEILALAGFDFVVIDAEHAAFGRADITTMTMAARAGGLRPMRQNGLQKVARGKTSIAEVMRVLGNG